MALVNLPVQVTFSLIDESGSKAQLQVNVNNAATLADIRTAANALIPLVQALTGCSVLGFSVAASTIETTALVGSAGSRVERRGLFSFRTAGGKIAQVTIPGLKEEVILSSGRIDEDLPEVEAFLAALLGAPYTDSNNSDLVSVVEAYETYRTTTKTQKPSQRRGDVDNTVGN